MCVLNRQSEGGKWDSIIPLEPLWEQYKRVIKDDGAIVLFAQGMFTAQLMVSQPKMWRYNPDRLGKFEGVSFSLDGVDGLRAAGGADHLAYVKGELFMEEARQLVK